MRNVFSDVNWDRWVETLWTHGLRILLIAAAVYIGLRLLRRAVEPALRAAISRQMEEQPDVEVEKRLETLSQVVHRSATVLALLLAAMMILPELGINIGALLAAAGLAGLAIGFGAQSLVKDVISGLFILVENQYAKGDVVNLAGVGGLVEEVNLRRTVLRDLDGAVHSIPNGEITVASNLTRSKSRVNLVIGVAYGEDLDRVFSVINRVGQELAADPAWRDDVIEAPKALGVEEFADSAVEIRILGETQPIRQWDVMRELRYRLKKAFDQEGIEIPFPHRTLVTAGQKAANGVVVRSPDGRPVGGGAEP
jgi:small conductance mechanosensitive channel